MLIQAQIRLYSTWTWYSFHRLSRDDTWISREPLGRDPVVTLLPYFSFKNNRKPIKMVQWLRMLFTKTDNQGLSPGTHVVERENLTQTFAHISWTLPIINKYIKFWAMRNKTKQQIFDRMMAVEKGEYWALKWDMWRDRTGSYEKPSMGGKVV